MMAMVSKKIVRVTLSVLYSEEEYSRVDLKVMVFEEGTKNLF